MLRPYGRTLIDSPGGRTHGRELELLNQIWALQRLTTNHFGPQQKLIKKTRRGAKVPSAMTRLPPPTNGAR